ncbi:Protein efr3 [Penicillium canariense]|uniref:Protein efr3 n=1 Tax=Penicillium canariense TaxID=189055 RepID=A0A9W9LGJ2_9EURO|nr:Protein efr3 [Penicillium canariense]KAJ5153487.1 Protein efr3 [Penicillium canariense]
MESVRQSCRPRHQVLTLKCFPRYQKGVPEVKPNPSELSYLLYYASTRRSKLTKVGAFLEKRVAKDVWRRRWGNVQVALHILTALIEKVPRELPIYARYVLSIIETILQSNDISMVEDSIATFETFCLHQDIAMISAEQGLAQKYREVIRIYAGFADPSSPPYSSAKISPPVAIRWRNAGLRAIKGVVSSESLAADGGTSLNIILPVILENLYSPNEDVLVPLRAKLRETENGERAGPQPRRISVATITTVDTVDGDPALAAQSTADADRQAEMDARLLALRCLEQIIVSGSNRGQIRIAASVTLRFIANKRFPRVATSEQSNGISQQSGNWSTSLIELIATWCPVQVRFVILMTAMDILHDTTPKEDALDSSFNILSVVDWLLKSSVNMIGLSVMDILIGLVRYISDILSPTDLAEGDTEKQAGPNADSAIFISPRRWALLSLLEQCIGHLATHNYYGDQVADMMRAILQHFKSSLNHDSAAQSSLATVHETGMTSKAPTNSATEQTNVEKAQGETFSHAAAKLTALRAVKAILVVANLRVPAITKGSETRNQVGIHVWEGTQRLLHDSDQEVRHAYADAFLSWLYLETNKQDLKVRIDTPKYIKPASKRDSEQAEKSSRRSTSAPGNHREQVALVAQSNFLRLLHLAIYDAAFENAAVESEVLVLHLLLVSLVENLGVNAAQFGLPMVMKLQEDLFTSVDLGSFIARVNVGSLVHGYLLALSEKFNLESTHAGVEIRNEIERRQSKGQWLSKIKLPPTGLDGIAVDEKAMDDDPTQSITLTPFRNVDGLVGGIDESYRQTISSPLQSPPTSLARGFSFPVLSHAQAEPHLQVESGLPSSVKEQMLSSWSRETCLAAVEKDSIKTSSISGSRGGTMTRNSHINAMANGSPAGSANDKNRRMSIPEISHTPDHSSGRGSPVRVTELRRVLSVNTESNPRRRSPLRGHVDASNISVISSGSESMVSGAFSVSEMEPEAVPSREEEYQQMPEENGTETPRASASVIAPSGEDKSLTDQAQAPTLFRTHSREIPPVPPIPVGLAIPGGFPNDSQRSLVSIDRPSTAPDNSRQSVRSATKSEHQQAARNGKSLNRNKSRSSHNLASGFSNVFGSADPNGSDSPLDTTQRDQLRKLLDGFLSPTNGTLTNGDRPATAVPASKNSLNESYSSRRQVSGGGLGRPPY